jgi:branched-chain amino acid transport system ATP-binding protein
MAHGLSDDILNFRDVTMTFGGVVAVNACTLSIARGAIEGIIGPNGAGKTTIFNLATGVYTPTAGTIALAGHDITRTAPSARVRDGIARTFQNIRLFRSATVLEHVLIAQDVHVPFLRRLASARARGPLNEQAREILEFTGLWPVRDRIAVTLSYGFQRRVEIARALATKPKLLLLDEPIAGMNADESAAIRELILRVRERGVTVLLIEHDMPFVMGLCDRIHVLDFGVIIAEGPPDDVRRDPAVLRAYIGDEEPVPHA